MRTSAAICYLFLLGLLCNAGSVSAGRPRDLLTEASVIEALNQYGTDLNEVAEFSLNAACNFSAVNTASLYPAAAALVQTFFSKKIGSYTVQQNTVAAPATTIANLSVGGAAVPALGQPAFPTSLSLYTYLQTYYGIIFNYYFSRPFFWTIDKPIVEDIVVRDADFAGATTAYISASNVNEGFICPGGVRGYRKQQSVYRHVMVLEDDAGGDSDRSTLSWRFIKFHEDNKGTVTLPQLPTQVQPAN